MTRNAPTAESSSDSRSWAPFRSSTRRSATRRRPTPHPTGVINTTDIAFQYDGVADFPTYPINALADLNAIAGFEYVHGTYLAPDGTTAVRRPAVRLHRRRHQGDRAACHADSTGPNCQTYGDTLYITIPAKALPIMTAVPRPRDRDRHQRLVKPVVALLQPATQTLIETGYDRTITARRRRSS